MEKKKYYAVGAGKSATKEILVTVESIYGDIQTNRSVILGKVQQNLSVFLINAGKKSVSKILGTS